MSTESQPPIHVAHIFTETGISLFLGGESYSIGRDHPNFDAIKDALRAKDFVNLRKLVDVTAVAQEWAADFPDFRIENGLVYYQDDPFDLPVSEKVIRMLREGAPPEPLFRFLSMLRENPSAVAQEELLLFCVANGFQIHEDGHIIAYKGVNHRYHDIYSDTVDNSVGQVVTMPRHKVDDRRNKTCSFGLHFAALEYARSWSGSVSHVMVLKIHPKDVVSIPHDYNDQKGRCCRYEVIAELEGMRPLPRQEVYSDRDLGIRPSDDVDRRVREVLMNELGVEAQRVQPHSTLADLGGDSLDGVEILLALEEEFNLDEIPEAEADQLRTVQDLVNFVRTHAPSQEEDEDDDWEEEDWDEDEED